MIPEIINFYLKKYAIAILLGVELEFYSQRDFDGYDIKSKFQHFQAIKKEVGLNQYELVSTPSWDIVSLLTELKLAKKHLLSLSTGEDDKVMFEAKPYLNMPGSSMHFNFTFFDLNNSSIINEKHLYFSYIIAGLCSSIRSSMLHFAPTVNSYKRFQYADIYTPLYANWGFNNRNTAIRVINEKFKDFRIEHRVVGADADIDKSMISILIAALKGMQNQLEAIPNEFGALKFNASGENRLPFTLTEAKRYFKNCAIDLA